MVVLPALFLIVAPWNGVMDVNDAATGIPCNTVVHRPFSTDVRVLTLHYNRLWSDYITVRASSVLVARAQRRSVF